MTVFACFTYLVTRCRIVNGTPAHLRGVGHPARALGLLLSPLCPTRISRRCAALELASALGAPRPPKGAARGRYSGRDLVYDPTQIGVNQHCSSHPHAVGSHVASRLTENGTATWEGALARSSARGGGNNFLFLVEIFLER